MSNLFAAAAAVGPKPLVSFRAGKMSLEGRMVKPDTRKGTVNITQGDDMLIHFQWKDRYTGTLEEDLVIFPEEAQFSRVEKCTTGRVYVLTFKDGNRQLFYWLQEPKDDKDEENCKKVNDSINSPPTSRPSPAAANDGAAASTQAARPGQPGMDNAVMQLLAQMQRQGAQGGAGAAVPAGAAPVPSGGPVAGGGLQLATLNNILAGLGGAVPNVPSANPPAGNQEPIVDVALQHVLEPDAVTEVAESNMPEFIARLNEHLPPCPDGVTPEEHLLSNVRSSQLQQTGQLFQAALEDPQAYSEIVTSFGLETPTNLAFPFGTNSFLETVQHASPPKDEEAKVEEKKEENNDSSDMKE